MSSVKCNPESAKHEPTLSEARNLIFFPFYSFIATEKHFNNFVENIFKTGNMWYTCIVVNKTHSTCIT